MDLLPLLLAGPLAGLVTGLTGGNGVGVVASVLLLGGVSAHSVVGLCLLVQLFTMGTTMVPMVRASQPPMALVGYLAVPAVACAILGAALALRLPEGAIRAALIVGLGLTGLTLVRAKERPRDGAPDEAGRKLNGAGLLGVAVAGAGSGLAAGTIGGGGNIIVANALYAGLGVPFRQAVAASLVLGVLAAAAGLPSYLGAGAITLSQGAAIVLPAIPAALLAARLALRVRVVRVRRMQGAYLLFVTALLLLWSLG